MRKDGDIITLTCCDLICRSLSEGAARARPTGDVVIPSYVGALGDGLFWQCESLTSVVIPNVSEIRYGAFCGCTGLTKLDLPRSLQTIGGFAFSNCTGLTSVTVPRNVIILGYDAFDGCTGLTSVSLPSGLYKIGSSAFAGCTSLTQMTIPENVKLLDDGIFINCTSLTRVTLPSSLTVIEDRMFEGCTSLTDVTIPDKVAEIRFSTFKDCSSLTSINIPVSVKTIGPIAFLGCTSLTDVYYGGTEEQWNAIDGLEWQKPLLAATIHFASGEDKKGTEDPAQSGGPAENSTPKTEPDVPAQGGEAPEGSTPEPESPVQDPEPLKKEPTEAEVLAAIEALKGEYPEGMSWTNDNSYYSAVGGFGFGCAGFAYICSDAAFGDAPITERHSDFDRIRVGDVLRINNDTHSVVVLQKKADSVIVAEGNYNKSIHWGREISRARLEQGGLQVATRWRAEAPEENTAATAYASTQTVQVDGKPVTFNAYALKDEKGNLTNYIKLRDVADILNGTAAQFQVGWDGTISITTGQAYTPNGTENIQNFTGDQAYTVSTSPVTVNGVTANLEAITLSDSTGGYTYFKLRDLGEALGFNVSWDAQVGITIDPNTPYNANN